MSVIKLGLQYGSRASYGSALSGCDTNGARFSTVADMQTWLTGGQPTEDPDMLDDERAALFDIQKRLGDYDATHPAATRLGTVVQRLTALRDGDVGHADLPQILAKLDVLIGIETAEQSQIVSLIGVVQALQSGGIDTTAAATQIETVLRQTLPGDVIAALVANLQTPAAPPAP
jgi:hypothetical protein